VFISFFLRYDRISSQAEGATGFPLREFRSFALIIDDSFQTDALSNAGLGYPPQAPVEEAHDRKA